MSTLRSALRSTVDERLGPMDDTSQTLKPWVTFGGCVLVIVILYWAQAVLVPIALAILIPVPETTSGHAA